MKNILYITLFIISGLWSCASSDEPINLDAQPYKRVPTYDTLSTDYTLNYVSRYYYNFDKLLIVDADSSDYWFNFTSSYKTIVGIDKPDAATAEMGVKMLDNLLIKWYDKDFISKHFPPKILIGSNVYTYTNSNTAQGLTKVQESSYNGAYFLMVKAANFDTMSVETKRRVAMALNNLLWTNIIKYRPFLNINVKFYSYGRDNKLYESTQDGNSWTGAAYDYDDEEKLTKKKVYQSGFLSYKTEIIDHPFDGKAITKVILPNESDDLNNWINFMLTTTEEQMQQFKTDYELFGTPTSPSVFEVKKAQIEQAFTDAGIDYRNLGYKPVQ